MSNNTGFDRAVDYVNKLDHFRATFESQDVGCVQSKHTVKIETGRKFDKVYVHTDNQNMGRYMVDRNSWTIYGIKSWAQVNDRRQYGTLDTIDQYDWSGYYGKPKPGTQAETEFNAREAQIQASYKKRGRPVKK